MIRALSSSLSLRLLGIFVVTSALIIFILITMYSRGLSGQWARSIRPHLVQYVQYVQDDLGSPPAADRADDLARRLPVDIHIYRQGRLIHATTDRKLELDDFHFTPIGRRPDRRMSAHARLAAQSTDSDVPSLSHVSISFRGSPQRILRILDGDYTVYYDLREPGTRRGHRMRFNDDLLLALAALAIVLTGSYLLIRRQLAPIRQIQNSVGTMSEGNLAQRIGRRGSSDLDVLANSIDGMAARLQAMLDAKRQLLIALSHELRSPVTRARINTELLPDSRIRERLLEDLADMERMIQDIMESELLQSRHSVLNTERLNLADLFTEELLHLHPDTPMQILAPHSSLDISGDAARLRILLRNLVLNALQHGRSEDGEAHITVTLDASPEHAVLRVSDEGAGITPEHLDEVSDPFYRPDPSRSRATGGFGLGLTLARLIAEAHAGRLSIDSDPQHRPGTCVIVELPRSGG